MSPRNDPPQVSVILPAYNAEAFLSRAMESVRNQSFPDWELLVVDDGSRDGTAALAEAAAASDPRIRAVISPRNAGAAAARNRGLAEARGRYIAYLDADDEWLPEKLSEQLAHLQATGASFGYCGFWRIIRGQRRRIHVPAQVTRAELLYGNVIGCFTAIYDSSVLGKVAMPDFPLSHDYALWLDLLERGPAVGIDRPLAIYHRQERSLSSNPWRSARGTWEVFRDHLQLSRGQAALCLGSHLARRVLRG
ncbi:glycosyltransferase family 2 protein [Salipiger thiooxidans]|jgi:teichuronic acid biosynthesis glycosyltransferase TuaG|uniref:Teichuronic acid biosynthesis glycosyltransferase TuaG n=1 Tax=Salipiger thiooxidans TaxID=282683 RepID=A0A1G7LPJ7_9RHOB|nr:glycosyltransferase family A protein [Salipiger thiooxidans]MBR9823323.1 glycosyltransferase family 2 protein [Paracoccaceae bacterium]MCA0849989.1 glycosyltransferase family 2 protein [Salipiger thiooxidans]SDF50920.1 teichuronic acid biosynthesis glycosyltransferase TuaG [Salipiger thiooxidans]